MQFPALVLFHRLNLVSSLDLRRLLFSYKKISSRDRSIDRRRGEELFRKLVSKLEIISVRLFRRGGKRSFLKRNATKFEDQNISSACRHLYALLERHGPPNFAPVVQPGPRRDKVKTRNLIIPVEINSLRCRLLVDKVLPGGTRVPK